ncbi:retropepsin-like aspartic protease family protein [Microbacterium gorillae]|uniref:retropepsin-like aspartic protease family protein n=1 Tax=Microbacterium gorillae TaxID=1231063 RepID=UPI00058D44A7|nr:retropepsin-like aspartic protease [Microbacterium gorillae]
MTIVPLTIEADAEGDGFVPVLPVTVAGREVRMVLDTGAARTSVPAGDATAFEDAGTSTVRGALGQVDARSVLVPSVRLGEVEVTGLTAGVRADGDGLLGMDVLRRHRLDLRTSSRELELDGDAAVPEVHELTLPSRSHVFLELVLGGQTDALAVWDTGASVSLVDAGIVASRPELFRPAGISTGTDAAGVSASSEMVMLPTFTIFGRRFAPSLAAVVDLAPMRPDGDPEFTVILGWPAIAQADWSFDFRAGRWGFLAEDAPR